MLLHLSLANPLYSSKFVTFNGFKNGKINFFKNLVINLFIETLKVFKKNIILYNKLVD